MTVGGAESAQRGVLDTSVFIARETGRPLAELPDTAAISVITLAELHLGVLMAQGSAVRARRLRTLTTAPYTQMGRYPDAVPLLERHLAAYPNQPWALALLVIAYVELGRDKEARAEAVKLKRISPEFLS